MKKYTIHQTFQCDNKWEDMTPRANGRHCGSCNKTVVDFTQMSDQDIIQFLLKNTHTCGLFKKSQLDRSMIIYSYKKRSNWPAIAAMLVAGLFAIAPNSVSAFNSTKPSIEYHPANNIEVEPSKTTQIFPVQLLNAKNNNLITWGSIYVDGLGTFYADLTGTIPIVYTQEIPDSFLVTIFAGGYISKVFTFYTKDLEKSNGATVYLEEQTEIIAPPGTVAIHEETPPQTPKK